MVLGAAFFITSISLALMSGGTSTGKSLLQEDARQRSSTATTPATPPSRSTAAPSTPSATPIAPPATAPAPGGK